MKRILILSMVAVMSAAPASAACRWEWDCSSGQCRQVPICNSTIDIVPPRPPEITPIAPPSIRPLPSLDLPPIGTRQCQQRYLCNSNGQCRWQNVCR